ncbi:MAG: hypothetical protein ACQEQU_03605 [Spirochaetota bacterium]
MSRESLYWAKLDNAALIFPVIVSKWNSSFYRLSATLTEPIDPTRLQKALDTVMLRFPYYQVRLKQGAFWLFLEHSNRVPEVELDRYYPCLTIKTPKQKELLIRVLYLQNRISVELSHILCDGFGGILFIKNLLAEYFRLQGVSIPVSPDYGILDLGSLPQPEESIDAFHEIYDPKAPKDKQLPPAYRIQAKRCQPGVNRVITGIVDTQQLLSLTRSLKVTITEYITAVLLYELQHIQQSDDPALREKPLRINVPVNLRKFYNLYTMKNFSLYTVPEIDPSLGYYTFKETLHAVHHYLQKNTTEKYIKQQISRNVGGEIHPLIRSIPIPIKKAFLKSMHTKYGESQQTTCFSNLGTIAFPEQMNPFIERFTCYTTGAYHTKTMISALSFKDKFYITFDRIIDTPILERRFFAFLNKQGLSVTVESNNQQGDTL